jgi:hypothetical protein
MLRRSLLSLILSVVVLSCDDATGPDDLLGTWRLQSVSGQSLPFILEQDGTTKVELTGETVTLLADGRQTMVTYFRVTEGGNVFTESIPAPGNYTVDGSTVLLTFDNDEDTYTAIVNGDAMTIEDIGLTFLYRRD